MNVRNRSFLVAVDGGGGKSDVWPRGIRKLIGSDRPDPVFTSAILVPEMR